MRIMTATDPPDLTFRAVAIGVTLSGLLAAMGWLWAGGEGIVVAVAAVIAQIVFMPAARAAPVLRLLGALPVTRFQAPELHAMAMTLADRAGLATPPRIYVMPAPSIEALSVDGREQHAVIVSAGALRHLDPREMQAVLAHEIAHLATGDIRLFRVAGALAGTVRALGTVGFLFVGFLMVFGGAAVEPWGLLSFALAPLAATLLEVGLWRTREYAADAGAAVLTGDPEGLARALMRIETLHAGPWARLLRGARRVMLPGLLRTHPRTQDRVRRLLAS